MGKVVVASPILAMLVEERTWMCWANSRDARDVELFCQHMAALVLPLYLDIGVEGVLPYKNQGLLEAIRNMPKGYEGTLEPGVISFDDMVTIWK